MFAIQNAAEWRRFCDGVMKAPHLAEDPRFESNVERLANRAALEALIEDRFRQHPRATVLRWLENADIATGSVNDVSAVAAHPQLAARGRWVEVDSPGGVIPALLPPHNLHGVSPRMGAVPALGQHTAEVLAELRSPSRTFTHQDTT
jgi:crotonobetainyl-CoA:carnitine CoA-transferase CaiB-like acyl-CoA transferase